MGFLLQKKSSMFSLSLTYGAGGSHVLGARDSMFSIQSYRSSCDADVVITGTAI